EPNRNAGTCRAPSIQPAAGSKTTAPSSHDVAARARPPRHRAATTSAGAQCDEPAAFARLRGTGGTASSVAALEPLSVRARLAAAAASSWSFVLRAMSRYATAARVRSPFDSYRLAQRASAERRYGSSLSAAAAARWYAMSAAFGSLSDSLQRPVR